LQEVEGSYPSRAIFGILSSTYLLPGVACKMLARIGRASLASL
jgi:hypothetical protein